MSTEQLVVPREPSADAHEDPAELARLREETRGLAIKLAEAGRHLKKALAEKERLSKILTAVIENLDAGVILVASSGRPLAHNEAARVMGLVVEDEELWGLSPALGVCLTGEWTSGGTLRPAGATGPCWLVHRRQIESEHVGPCEVLLVQDIGESLALQEEAHRRSRLEGLGRMLAEVSHQIRNPLGSLELFAAMLIDDLEDRPEQQEIALELLSSVRQLSATVTNLLSRVRDRKARRSEVCPDELVQECAAALRPVFLARSVELELRLPEEVGRALVDAEGLRQATLNLLDNAMQATGQGGRVLLELRRSATELSLRVSDDGPGVPPELRAQLLEPFFTTRAEGTGLGLALVERVASAHGGQVLIGDSSLGGACFDVRLALSEHPGPSPPTDTPSSEDPS